MNYKIQRITEFEFPRLAFFLSKNYEPYNSKEYWIKRFNNWWLKNPFHNTCDSKGYFVVDGKEVLGLLGCFTTKLSKNNSIVSTTNITTWCVHPKARNHSLSLFRTLLKELKTDILFCTTGSNKVVQILKGSNFRSYLNEASLTSSIIPLNYIRLIGFKIFKKRITIPLLTPFIKKLTLLQHQNKINDDDADIRLKFLNIESQSAINNFAQKLNSLYFLTTNRNFEYFDWFVFSDETFEKIAVGIYQNNKLEATAIFTVIEKEIKVLECLDYVQLLSLDEKKAIDRLKQFAFNFAVDKDCDLISFPNYSGFPNSSMRQVKRGENNKYFYFKSPGELDLSSTYLTCQGDVYV